MGVRPLYYKNKQMVFRYGDYLVPNNRENSKCEGPFVIFERDISMTSARNNMRVFTVNKDGSIGTLKDFEKSNFRRVNPHHSELCVGDNYIFFDYLDSGRRSHFGIDIPNGSVVKIVKKHYCHKSNPHALATVRTDDGEDYKVNTRNLIKFFEYTHKWDCSKNTDKETELDNLLFLM